MQTRVRRGLTQRELAERIGVPYQQIQKYERGEKLTLERLTLIARELGLNLSSLLMALAFCVATFLIVFEPKIARAGERLECFAEPLGKDWHYRTKVPGFAGDVRGDRCWYDGPSMKPRSELYWPAEQEAPIEMTPLPPARPPGANLISFQDRWEGLAAR